MLNAATEQDCTKVFPSLIRSNFSFSSSFAVSVVLLEVFTYSRSFWIANYIDEKEVGKANKTSAITYLLLKTK